MKKQGGFTILEVSLYLSISAILTLMIVGIISLVQQHEWQESLNQTRSLVQTQYQDVTAGINDHLSVNIASCQNNSVANSSQSGTSPCVMVGRVLGFGASVGASSSSYCTADVIATSAQDGDSTNSGSQASSSLISNGDIAALANSNLIMSNSSCSGKLPWSSTSSGGYVAGNSSQTWSANNKSFTALAILRSPLSGALYTFAFGGGMPSSLTVANGNPVPIINASNVVNNPLTTPMAVVVSKGSSQGAICINPGSSASNIIAYDWATLQAKLGGSC